MALLSEKSLPFSSLFFRYVLHSLRSLAKFCRNRLPSYVQTNKKLG